ncbi:MAG: hypothetical protein AAF408_10140, partial [Pseudomonadota bacterium]
LLLASFPQLADPFIRHDDYPALLAAPGGFYEKTLHEGRWLNYWWHLRGAVTPPWLNFAVYQLFWAAFCAGTAIASCGRDAPRAYVALLSILLALSVPAMLISLWFNTLLPGLGLMAAFALMATRLSPRTMRLLLLVFVPVTLTAYTTYPLMLLCICLVMPGQTRSLKDLMVLIGMFALSFALGMLSIYTLNLFEHGVFGIPMAEWRNPNPAQDLASFASNLAIAGASLLKAARVSAFDMIPLMAVHVGILVAVMGILFRRDRWFAIYILSGAAAGIGLLCLQVLMSGVALPERATGFVWMLYVIGAARALLLCRDDKNPAERWLRLALMIVAASYMIQTVKQYSTYVAWQSETRAMADILGPGTDPVYVTGNFKSLASAQEAHVQEARGLRLRLHYLTGRWITDCAETPQHCPDIPAYAGPLPHIAETGTAKLLYLP